VIEFFRFFVVKILMVRLHEWKNYRHHSVMNNLLRYNYINDVNKITYDSENVTTDTWSVLRARVVQDL
jgi:hypothetical protein